uniref:Uncharacterized protein n=1 Tax=Rhizophora mucronata TaxID=61149 RepID=A0A2P2PT46_RHIMU
MVNLVCDIGLTFSWICASRIGHSFVLFWIFCSFIWDQDRHFFLLVPLEFCFIFHLSRIGH